MRISAISLNRGEVRRAQAGKPGFNPAWDLAGAGGEGARGTAEAAGPRRADVLCERFT